MAVACTRDLTRLLLQDEGQLVQVRRLACGRTPPRAVVRASRGGATAAPLPQGRPRTVEDRVAGKHRPRLPPVHVVHRPVHAPHVLQVVLVDELVWVHV